MIAVLILVATVPSARTLETMPLAGPKRVNWSRPRDDGDACEPGIASPHSAGPAASEDSTACRRVSAQSCYVVLCTCRP